MNPRVEYEMTEEDLQKILDACKPTPVMYLSGGQQMGGSPQENANRAWAELGRRIGFDSMSVRPIQGKGQRFFTAVPSETDNQKGERLQREEAEKRQAQIVEHEAAIQKHQRALAELRQSETAQEQAQ